MKTKITFLAILHSALFTLHSAFSQGTLTPPGPPGPTMLTLSQIQPRTPISSAPYTITQPGSYYLTANLTVGSGQTAILITTNGVALDLNGFTLSSTAATPNATAILFASGLTDIKVFNGQIRSFVTNNGASFAGTGFGFGIYYPGATPPMNVEVSQVTVSGVSLEGIYLGIGASTTVKSCNVSVSGGNGIVATTISDSTALNCGGTAIDGYNVQNCYGYSVDGDGIDAINAINCYGYTGSGTGIRTDSAENCTGYSSTDNGISAETAQNCYANSNGGGSGILAETAMNCTGLSISGPGVNVYYIAIGCFGSSSTGNGIEAYIANSCFSTSGDSGITDKYNMP